MLLSWSCPANATEYIGEYNITAYCGCETCCGEWSSDPVIGSGGVPLYEGTHVAAHLPNGTKLYIEGIGYYEVQDTPAEGMNIIDIYFNQHNSAVNFGVKRGVKVYILSKE